MHVLLGGSPSPLTSKVLCLLQVSKSPLDIVGHISQWYPCYIPIDDGQTRIVPSPNSLGPRAHQTGPAREMQLFPKPLMSLMRGMVGRQLSNAQPPGV